MNILLSFMISASRQRRCSDWRRWRAPHRKIGAVSYRYGSGSHNTVPFTVAITVVSAEGQRPRRDRQKVSGTANDPAGRMLVSSMRALRAKGAPRMTISADQLRLDFSWKRQELNLKPDPCVVSRHDSDRSDRSRKTRGSASGLLPRVEQLRRCLLCGAPHVSPCHAARFPGRVQPERPLPRLRAHRGTSKSSRRPQSPQGCNSLHLIPRRWS